MDLGLQGRTALITGSYRGTGRGIARVMAREGANVIVHGFEQGQAEPLVAELGDRVAVVGDICTDAGAQAVADAAGGVDILVNNYGTSERGNWVDSPPDDWFKAYDKNVVSGVRMSRLLIPSMRERGWGRVVLVGTLGSVRPNSRNPQYYASKAALPAITVSLAKELGGTGVTVNLVSPGLVATDEVKAWMEGRDSDPTAGNPVPRPSEPEEVGDLVAFLASPRADTICGVNIRIDGGAADVVAP